MPDTEIRTEPTRRSRTRFAWPVGIAVAVLVVIGAVGPHVFHDRAMVDRVTFTNSTVYAVDVEVTGAQRDGWLPLVRAERGTTTELDDVVDQGSEWIFHFESQGEDGGELRISRDDLVRNAWRVDIADAVAGRLAAHGAPPTPVPND